MPVRENSDTPDFDRQVMGALDEPMNNDQQSQQQTQDHTQADNTQQRQPDQTQQQQTDQNNIDNIIARTDGTPPPNQQQPNNQQKPNQQQQRQPNPQNVVLDDEGKPVSGEARRHFFKRKEAERVAERTTRENTTLKAQVQTFQQLHQQIAQSGLSAEEQAVSLALGKKLKANPVEAVKEILTTLQASGINISGAIGVNTIDTASIAQLIDQKLKPFTDRHLSEQQQEQHQQLEADVQAFFDEEPLAQMHAGPLNTLLQRFPTWSLDKAWSVLQVESIKNGLDINQPLGPQIAAKRNGSRQPNNAGAHVQMTSPGRGNGSNLQQPQARSFGHNARTGDIVLDAMAKAGMDITRLQ